MNKWAIEFISSVEESIDRSLTEDERVWVNRLRLLEFDVKSTVYAVLDMADGVPEPDEEKTVRYESAGGSAQKIEEMT